MHDFEIDGIIALADRTGPPPPYCGDMIDTGEMTCAHCGEHYLHRTETRHYLRSEDSGTGTVVVTSPDGSYTMQAAPMDGNPSSRRSGLTVKFFCELCGKLSQLSLAQHKGSTSIRWTAVPDGWPSCD